MKLKKIGYRIHDIQDKNGRCVIGYAVNAGPGMPMFCVRQVVRGYWTCDDYITGAKLASIGASGATRKDALEKAIPVIKALWQDGSYQKAQRNFIKRYL